MCTLVGASRHAPSTRRTSARQASPEPNGGSRCQPRREALGTHRSCCFLPPFPWHLFRALTRRECVLRRQGGRQGIRGKHKSFWHCAAVRVPWTDVSGRLLHQPRVRRQRGCVVPLCFLHVNLMAHCAPTSSSLRFPLSEVFWFCDVVHDPHLAARQSSQRPVHPTQHPIIFSLSAKNTGGTDLFFFAVLGVFAVSAMDLPYRSRRTTSNPGPHVAGSLPFPEKTCRLARTSPFFFPIPGGTPSLGAYGALHTQKHYGRGELRSPTPHRGTRGSCTASPRSCHTPPALGRTTSTSKARVSSSNATRDTWFGTLFFFVEKAQQQEAKKEATVVCNMAFDGLLRN